MAADFSNSGELRERIERRGRICALELFTSHRDRLRRMVKLRLDRRLQGRLDASDVLQEAYIDVARRARVRRPVRRCRSFWLAITGQRLVTLHRKHLAASAGCGAGGFPLSWCAAPGHLGLPGRHAVGPADLTDSRVLSEPSSSSECKTP